MYLQYGIKTVAFGKLRTICLVKFSVIRSEEDKKLAIILTNGVRTPNLLQNVTLQFRFFPVLSSNEQHVWKGGEYKCSETA